MVLSYTTPKRHRQTVEVPFELDGENYTARKPKDSIMVYLTAATSENASDADRMYAVMQFINGCLTPAAQARIQARLRDYDDDLELDDLLDLMNDLAEEFGAGVKTTGGGAGKVITPDGETADDITPANRADRRAAARKPAPKKAAAKTAAKAVRAPAAAPVIEGTVVAKKTAAGRRLPR